MKCEAWEGDTGKKKSCVGRGCERWEEKEERVKSSLVVVSG